MRQLLNRFGISVLVAVTVLVLYAMPASAATYNWSGYQVKVPRYLNSYFDKIFGTSPSETPAPVPQPEEQQPIPTPEPKPQVPEPKPQVPEPKPTPSTPSAPAGLSASEDWMFNKINEERAKAGVRPLIRDPELDRIARIKSQDLVDNNYFAHESPTYGSVSNILRSFGYSFRGAGENLAKSQSAEISHYRLMASDGHRSNILYSAYTHVGIGVVRYKSGVMVTQIFAIK